MRLAKVHDLVSIMQLDKNKIVIGDDGTVKLGLEGQPKSLRESKASLF